MSANQALMKLRNHEMALGMGLFHLRTAAAPLMAKTAGYDWLFIDLEHGAFSLQEASQLCLAAASTGVTPIVRVCHHAIDEATRLLDNGAMGVVIPHVSSADVARDIVQALKFSPLGNRSWGAPPTILDYKPTPIPVAKQAINRETLLIALIETPEGVEAAEAIAATEGIDALMIGTTDLSVQMNIDGDFGHPLIQQAYERVGAACRKHRKFFGMGGVYEEKWLRLYLSKGARLVLAGNDHNLLFTAAAKRAEFLHSLQVA